MEKETVILHILGAFNMGGVETMVMNIYKNIDFNKLKFDFIVNGAEIGYYEDQLNLKCSKIFHIAKRSDSLIRHFFDIYCIVKNGNYCVVHYHAENSFLAFTDLLICKLAGAKELIVHSHNTMDYRGGFIAKLSKFFQKPLYYLASQRLSCGEEAANWLYGTTTNVQIVPLPVDCKKYLYSKQKHDFFKNEYNFTDFKIYTHIGSFSKVKNQLFLLDIFNEIFKINNKSILLLIGGGNDEDLIKNKILDLNLQNNVFLLGVIDDVSNKLIMSDAFIFPSLFEGFPTVLLEAQAAGLPCFVSDTITDKIKLTDSVYFLSISKTPKEWAEFIVNNCNSSEKSRQFANSVISNKYDINKIVDEFYNIYKVN